MIYEFFSCFSNIPRGLSAYKPEKLVVYCLNNLGIDLIICLFSDRNCGIEDPSWSELRYFVNFLNSQLQACEESSFCNMDSVGDTLEGFRSFVVRFMILMSRVRVE